MLSVPCTLPVQFERFSISDASACLNGEIYLRNRQVYAIGGNLDKAGFDFDFTFPQDTATTNLYFYSLHYVGSMIIEYQVTGNENWLELSKSIIQYYIQYIETPENIINVFTNRGSGSADHGMSIRIAVLLLFYREYGKVDRLDNNGLLSSISDHIIECGEWLFDDANHAMNNHGLMVNVALASIGVSLANSYSELSKRFIAKADKRLAELMTHTFDCDGYANENTIGYHRYNLLKYIEAENLFRKWGIDNSDYLNYGASIINRAKKALSFCVWQDGTIPPIGDWPVHSVEYESLNSSKCFSESGFAVIKNDDLYVSIICGRRTSAHKHVDDTSITIRYCGEDICIDGGNYNFDRSSPYRQCL